MARVALREALRWLYGGRGFLGSQPTKTGMHASRTNFGLASIKNVLYAVGGVHFVDPFTYPSKVVFNAMEAYDPSTNTWTDKAPMPTARRGVAVGVINNILYVVGGAGVSGAALNSVEAYDPATNTWMTMPPMPTPRDELAVAVLGNVVYAMAGETSGQPLITVEALTP